MIVNWYSDSDRHNQGLLISAKESKPNQEVGNYKHIEITVTDQKQNVEDKSKLYLGLYTSLEGEEHAHRILKIEDMPKFYNPIYEYYIINWHMLEEMKYQ